MNEIDPKTARINKISSLETDKKPSKPVQKGDGSFDQLLADQIQTKNKETAFKQAAVLPEIEGAFKARELDLLQSQPQLVQKLAACLNLLETYADCLQNPEKSLKQAHAILEQASAQTKNLTKEFKETSTNKDLGHILAGLATTIEVEQIKFNRGDYTN